MSLGVTIDVVAGDGVKDLPVETLAKIIDLRRRMFCESTKDAVIATAINVLVGLRARTRDARKGRRKPKVVVREECQLYHSWTMSGGRRRCLRVGHAGQRPRGPRWNPHGLKVRWLTKGSSDSSLKVWRVVPEHTSVKPYYVIAANRTVAEDYERRAAQHRKDTFGTLAKWGLGVAMNKISTKNVSDNVSGLARQTGSRLANVLQQESGYGSGEFAVQVTDTLDYAIDALKGSDSVQLAMQAAANKSIGMLERYTSRFGTELTNKMWGPLDIPPPFPLVRRNK